MEYINIENIKQIEIKGFSKIDTIYYQNLVALILDKICEFLVHNGISYDFNLLNEKINSLQIICRNKQSSVYDEENNVLYICTINQNNDELEEKHIIFTFIHELIHFTTPLNNESSSISKKYYAFVEFFTEYFAFIIASKIDSIGLIPFYQQNLGGYFNKNDHVFMQLLIQEVGFIPLLNAFYENDGDILQALVGDNVLYRIQDYFVYFNCLYDAYGQPLKVLNRLLETTLNSQKIVLQEKIIGITEHINNINSNKKA